MLLVLVSKLLGNALVNIGQLSHQTGSLAVVGSIFDFLSQALALLGVRVEGVIHFAISELLDLSFDALVVLGSLTKIVALLLALEAFLLGTESLFVATLLLHFVNQHHVVVNLVGETGCIATLVLFCGTKIFLQLFAIIKVLSNLGSCFSLNLTEFLGFLKLSLILATCTASLELVLKFATLLGELLAKLFLYILLGVLVVLKYILEVLVTSCVLQPLLEFSKLISLLDFELFLKILLLKLTLGLILSEILLELILDFNNDLVHLGLLLGLVVSQLCLNFVELVGKLLAFETACVQASSKQLVLLSLILLHHVFHALHLVLKLIDHANDFIT